ncbi:hypothetical protein DE146DRAFT_627178 [Phaeosphaeria sp. MPI-PUGE-AT-0046c]|nr:hypothetical protein DE146DRAFT_627178 [Phaeosphaeria sp. MPI-PUGE-AT-0046c]
MTFGPWTAPRTGGRVNVSRLDIAGMHEGLSVYCGRPEAWEATGGMRDFFSSDLPLRKARRCRSRLSGVGSSKQRKSYRSSIALYRVVWRYLAVINARVRKIGTGCDSFRGARRSSGSGADGQALHKSPKIHRVGGNDGRSLAAPCSNQNSFRPGERPSLNATSPLCRVPPGGCILVHSTVCGSNLFLHSATSPEQPRRSTAVWYHVYNKAATRSILRQRYQATEPSSMLNSLLSKATSLMGPECSLDAAHAAPAGWLLHTACRTRLGMIAPNQRAYRLYDLYDAHERQGKQGPASSHRNGGCVETKIHRHLDPAGLTYQNDDTNACFMCPATMMSSIAASGSLERERMRINQWYLHQQQGLTA